MDALNGTARCSCPIAFLLSILSRIMGDEIRRINIKRNVEFLEQLGFTTTNSSNEGTSENDKRKKSRRSNEYIESTSPTRRSARRMKKIEEAKQNNVEYTCKQCNNGKSYFNLHGLHIHQRQNCPAMKNYKPKNYYKLTDDELNKIFHLHADNSSPQVIATVEQPSAEICTVEQTIYEDQPDELYHESDCINDFLDNDFVSNDGDNSRVIATFLRSQENLCASLFGKRYIGCETYEEMVVSAQEHYLVSNNATKQQKLLNDHQLHNFSVSCGLSRKHGNDLLRVIRAFNPTIPVPKTILGIENRMRNEMMKYNDCAKLSVPWIAKWRMHELKGFQTIKIYVRNIFEVISHMLIDPEIMWAWREHVMLRYRVAVDRSNKQVYSDVMTSNWAKETETMVLQKNPHGYLMPLIFYTDGVQVSASVHNKVTPVIVSIGNFSDALLQKDISKRVIAYLPNFKCYSKALMISHIMSKLGVSKTQVRI